MAGSEKTGLAHASGSLYRNAIIFLCSFTTDDPAAINIVREFWRELGANPIEVDALKHDDAVSHSSHMLHLLSASIVRTVLSGENEELRGLACAGGFRDVTRIASSSPAMWTEVIEYNKDAVLNSLNELLEEVTKAKTIVEDGKMDELKEYFQFGKDKRDHWFNNIYQAK